MLSVSVIVSYYKALDNLIIILKALALQSYKNFEVIVSEDDNNYKTTKYLLDHRKDFDFPILHTKQNEDNGFRKNMMLNKSIKISTGKVIVFIDGDCVPHKHFIKQYVKNIEENSVLKGRRVMLSKKITESLRKKINFNALNFFNILFSKSKKKKNAIYSPFFNLSYKSNRKWLIGCNWGAYKDVLLKVNGFDEDYKRASVGEDNDIEWRFKKIGIKEKSVKNKAIVYHLYHASKYAKEDLLFNKNILKKKQKENNFFCLNGIEKVK